ncbi:hypothetical protein EVAR_103025_1 [Eumeta japonica]|uniref:Uncharacterized protein n=1 Tax=Eumeta variegata TaxID=151549 RepID=A0A4C1WCN6_EUMVA|nr:hypothetical protein EVAR_103025_1 [Eumeta japonica]
MQYLRISAHARPVGWRAGEGQEEVTAVRGGEGASSNLVAHIAGRLAAVKATHVSDPLHADQTVHVTDRRPSNVHGLPTAAVKATPVNDPPNSDLALHVADHCKTGALGRPTAAVKTKRVSDSLPPYLSLSPLRYSSSIDFHANSPSDIRLHRDRGPREGDQGGQSRRNTSRSTGSRCRVSLPIRVDDLSSTALKARR